MRRFVLVGMASITLLGITSVAFLALMTRSRGSLLDEGVGLPADAGQAIAEQPAPSLSIPLRNVPPSPYGPAPAMGARAPEPLTDLASWQSVPPLKRWPALMVKLAEERPRMARCFGETEQAGSEWAAPRRRAGRGLELRDPRVAVLMLHVETSQDQVRILAAPVEQKGEAGDDLLACVQSALVGRTLDVPRVTPGSRIRVPYTAQ